jgi:hypothetical protein
MLKTSIKQAWQALRNGIRTRTVRCAGQNGRIRERDAHAEGAGRFISNAGM